MREDYKIQGPKAKIELELEQVIVEKLAMMEKFTQLSRSEIANTALKRFISQHKDFLPEQEKRVRT